MSIRRIGPYEAEVDHELVSDSIIVRVRAMFRDDSQGYTFKKGVVIRLAEEQFFVVPAATMYPFLAPESDRMTHVLEEIEDVKEKE